MAAIRLGRRFPFLKDLGVRSQNLWTVWMEWLALLYTGAVAGWIVMWRLWGDANGPLSMLNAWAFWALLTGLPMGTLSLWRRARPWSLLWLAGVGALFYERYLRHWSPRHSEAVTGDKGERLTIFSANMLNVARDLRATVEAIRREKADVLLFQEAIATHTAQLERGLAADYPHRCWVPYLPTNLGLGIASRVPFAVTGFWQKPGLEPYALRVTLALPGGPVDVYCVHFMAPLHEIKTLGATRHPTHAPDPDPHYFGRN